MSGSTPKARPEATFGSHLAVWRNANGRSITVKNPQYQKDGAWHTSPSWTIQEAAWLATCLREAVSYCLQKRMEEERLRFESGGESSPNE